MSYSVGEVARIAGVTVRTLHHYDEIGLLTVQRRSRAGYRRYSTDDLDRLQRVLAYRELGFSLEEIAAILDDPTVDRVEHLRRQHSWLTERIERLRAILATLERTMEAHQMGIKLTPQEMLEVFGEHDPTEHAKEAEERWGDTDAYRESQRRTSSYTKEDWLQIKQEAEEIEHRLAAARTGDLPADSAEAMDAAEAHRRHISRWFYELPYDGHRALGDMYVADPRFRARYEQLAEGLAEYVRDAIHANADRGSGAPA